MQGAKQSDGNFHATFHDVTMNQSKYITENAYTETAMFSRNLGFARFDQSTDEHRPYFFIKEYDATALRHMPIKLTEGRYPEKAGEILISEEARKSGGQAYRIGETIAVELGERFDPDGEALAAEMPLYENEQFTATATGTYTITGYIAKPHFEHFTSTPGLPLWPTWIRPRWSKMRRSISIPVSCASSTTGCRRCRAGIQTVTTASCNT